MIEHLEENIAVAEIQLTADEFELLSQVKVEA
jgi:aryl-alcohol dehydrogenase-like predicted oxidoreductase